MFSVFGITPVVSWSWGFCGVFWFELISDDYWEKREV